MTIIQGKEITLCDPTHYRHKHQPCLTLLLHCQFLYQLKNWFILNTEFGEFCSYLEVLWNLNKENIGEKEFNIIINYLNSKLVTNL